MVGCEPEEMPNYFCPSAGEEMNSRNTLRSPLFSFHRLIRSIEGERTGAALACPPDSNLRGGWHAPQALGKVTSGGAVPLSFKKTARIRETPISGLPIKIWRKPPCLPLKKKSPVKFDFMRVT